MENNRETAAWCALNRVFGYEPMLGRRLAEAFGGAEAVFGQREETLREALGPRAELAERLREDTLRWAEEDLERTREEGGRFLPLGSGDYPELLAECPDPPLGLYFRGESSPAEVFGFRPCIAFVGTRDASPYGREWCRRLVGALEGAGTPPVIVSGLAFGIDGIAHATALECGLPTVGVMATGLDNVYPWQHRELSGRIVRSPGSALVTDYPRGSAPVALNFIRRNRIIAGLSRAVVVIESKSKGGSLITARYANEYDRDVYALPGRADDPRSRGCNSLIRYRMADLILSPEDLADRLGLQGKRRPAAQDLRTLLERRYGPGSTPVRLGLAVKEHRGITREELAGISGIPLREVLGAIVTLESDGFIVTDLLGRCSILAKNR